MQSIAPLSATQLRAKVKRTRYKFELYVGAAWVDLCDLAGGYYLKSVSVNPSGAGPTPEVVAGTWSADIANPGGIFHPFHPTSAYKDYFRVGRKVRISIGGVFGGTTYYWQRLIGYMDAPHFDHKTRSVSLSGCDFSKQLADFAMREPDNYWGSTATFSTTATAATYGAEKYAEADAMDTLAEANNVTNWAETNANFASQADGGGGSTYVGLLEAVDLNQPASVLDEDVGSFTANHIYFVSFKYKRTSTNPVTCKLSCRLYKTGTTTLWGGIANLISTSWVTASFQFTCPETAAGRMKVEMTAPVQAGRYVQIDQISIKEITGQINTRYDMPAACNGPHYAVLNGVAYQPGDDDKGWHYDEAGRIFYFDDSLTIAAGTNNLVVHYYTDQIPEEVVADILADAGLYADKATALAAMSYTATGVTIPKVWFAAGTSGIEAIKKICERVNYRFWFDYAGVPQFKPAPTAGTADFAFESFGDLAGLDDHQDLEQLRNRIVIDGAEQAMYAPREDRNRSRLTGSAFDPTSIATYLEHTESMRNHLFQDQPSLDAMCATLLAERKDPKWYSDVSVPYNPVPLELGDTITWKAPLDLGSGGIFGEGLFGTDLFGLPNVMLTITGIVRDVKINGNSTTYRCEIISAA